MTDRRLVPDSCGSCGGDWLGVVCAVCGLTTPMEPSASAPPPGARTPEPGDNVTLFVHGAGCTSEEPHVVASVDRQRGVFYLEHSDREYSLATGRWIGVDEIFGFTFRVKEVGV
jgi:hypothetical protein